MPILTREAVRAVLGPVDDTLVIEILKTGASLEELVEAHAWMTNDETAMNIGKPLASGRVDQLIGLLEAEEDEEVPSA